MYVIKAHIIIIDLYKVWFKIEIQWLKIAICLFEVTEFYSGNSVDLCLYTDICHKFAKKFSGTNPVNIRLYECLS